MRAGFPLPPSVSESFRLCGPIRSASANGLPAEKTRAWLPDLDSNQDKEIQNLRCCHYTIGQGKGWEIEALCARVKDSERQNGLVSQLAFRSATREKGFMLIHTVLFWLKPEVTPEQRDAMAAGLRSLAGIKAAEAIYVGTPAPLPARPVRDSSYDFSLTVVFRDIPSHDRYQVDPLHKAYNDTFRPLWAKIQVFDAQ